MNWLQKIILGKDLAKQLEEKANPIPYQSGVKYQIINGRITTPADNVTTFIRDGYSINDIIYAITNLICDKIRLPEWGLYKVVDESSLKKYRSLISRKNLSGKEFKQALRLKETSLQPIDNFNLQQGKLDELLKYPNDYCSFQDLVAEGALFKLLTGNMFWLGDVLNSGANGGIPNSIEQLPAQFMFIKISDGFPAKPIAYNLYIWGQQWPREQILHDKYANPNWDINGQQLYGMSPLKAALKNITRNNSAKDASTAKFQNGGLETIAYMDDPRFTPAEGKQQIQALKQQLAEEYGGPANQGKLAISGYKVGAVPLGLSPVDLDIINSEKWDAIMFCNIYGVPPELLGLVNKTFNNAREAEKALTTRSAIPLLNSIRNSFNRKIQTDWGFKGQNVYIEMDLDCFQELKVDEAEVVNTTSKMIFITPNEEREQMGWDLRPEPEADEVWVMSGGNRVPLTDFQANAVDAQLNADALRQNIQNGTNAGATAANQANGNAQVSQDRQGKAGMPIGNGAHVSFTKAV